MDPANSDGVVGYAIMLDPSGKPFLVEQVFALMADVNAYIKEYNLNNRSYEVLALVSTGVEN